MMLFLHQIARSYGRPTVALPRHIIRKWPLLRSAPMSAESLKSNNNGSNSTPSLYLHVGPSGDCWTGASIFAAKHLQPDYVKSIPLPLNICVESLVEELEEDISLTQQIYDEGALPSRLLVRLVAEEDT